jgi:hypothetical protein
VTPREIARLKEAIALRRAELARTSSRPFIPHTPYPKQAEFLRLPCLEAFYGGAVGGGKSDALLMGALEYVHVPGYAALLLRRTYADLSLPGAIMERSHGWLQGTGATWNGTDKRWTFPSGATLTFGYLDTEKDKYRYASAEFQYIGFDEVTQFPEGWYRFLLSRLRGPVGLGVPMRARSAGNPGGIGHLWVKKRFVDSTGPECRFVPANLADNPALDAVAYRKSLAQLDENTRRQLEDGVWIQDAGGLVYSYDPARNDVAKVPALTTHLIGIDYGFTDATAFTVLGWREQDPVVYVVESYKRTGLTPSDAAEEAHRLSATYKPVQMVGDVGGLGKGYAEEARRRFTLPIEPAEKQNKRGYQALLNGDLERGRVKVATTKAADLVAEWVALPWKEDRSAEAEGFDNHCADATLYAWRAACAYHEREAPPPLTPAEQLRAEEAALVVTLEQEAEKDARGEWWET